MEKKIIGCWNKSVILTYIGIAASVIGMGAILVHDNLRIALTCLMIAGICDMFDGTVARLCKRTEQEKQFGIQIDSLADVVCSVVFPVVIFMHSVEINTNIRQTVNSEMLTYLIATLYIVCGVARLTWFNINTADKDNKAEYYTGLAVTYIAVILPIMHLIGFIFDLCNLTYYITMLVTSFLFVANFKMKKPGKVSYIVFMLLAIVVTVMVWLFIK